MKEFTIEIDIDENGNIRAETKGMDGEICITELDDVLEGLEGERSDNYKPEFYKKTNLTNKLTQKNS